MFETEKLLLEKKFFLIANSMDKKKIVKVLESASMNNIIPELLFSIIINEMMNRGQLMNIILEKTLSKICASLLVELDASIGLGQVRISTAKKVSTLSSKQLAKELTKEDFNIEIVAKLLKLYVDQTSYCSSPIQKIVNLYTTGQIKPVKNKELDLYYHLVIWSVKQQVLQKICKKNYLDV